MFVPFLTLPMPVLLMVNRPDSLSVAPKPPSKSCEKMMAASAGAVMAMARATIPIVTLITFRLLTPPVALSFSKLGPRNQLR